MLLSLPRLPMCRVQKANQIAKPNQAKAKQRKMKTKQSSENMTHFSASCARSKDKEGEREREINQGGDNSIEQCFYATKRM